jgi:hypothetical protein
VESRQLPIIPGSHDLCQHSSDHRNRGYQREYRLSSWCGTVASVLPLPVHSKVRRRRVGTPAGMDEGAILPLPRGCPRTRLAGDREALKSEKRLVPCYGIEEKILRRFREGLRSSRLGREDPATVHRVLSNRPI